MDSGVFKNWLGVGEVKDKIVISFKPNSPYKVTKSTKGINVTFDVTNSGMEAFISKEDPNKDRWLPERDFAPIITLIE